MPKDGEPAGTNQYPKYIAIVTTIASALGCSLQAPVTGYWFRLIVLTALVLCLVLQTMASILSCGGVVGRQVGLPILLSPMKA